MKGSVNIEYQVSVVATVDLDTKRVVCVHVDDENISEPILVYDDDKYDSPLPPTSTRAKKALDIAFDGDWPAWEFGW